MKQQVRDYWDDEPCGSGVTSAPKFSSRYFQEIAQNRYSVEPEILSFASFGTATGKRVLEVGVGAGTDFAQWVRAGAFAYGIDLSERAVEHTKALLQHIGQQAEYLRVADAEALPFPNSFFDIVYSWGVLHHTPDISKALSEIVRVTKPEGTIKLMVYNRRSLAALYLWLSHAPLRSCSWVIGHCLESPNTKAYTKGELLHLLKLLPVTCVSIETPTTQYDLLWNQGQFIRTCAKLLCRLVGRNHGWFTRITLEKK